VQRGEFSQRKFSGASKSALEGGVVAKFPASSRRSRSITVGAPELIRGRSASALR